MWCTHTSDHSGIIVSITSHILWGFHPVCARYLQTRPHIPLNGFTVLAVAQLLVFGMNSIVTIAKKSEDEYVETDDDKEHMLPIISDTVRKSQGNGSNRQWFDRKTIETSLLFGTVAAVRATSNMSSTRFTLAYNIQLISMVSPMITAIVSSLMIQEKLPWTLWPCLICSGCGEAIVLLAQAGMLTFSRSPIESLNHNDIIGISLQFISLFFSAYARVLMVTTKETFTPSQLMGVQYLFTSIPLLCWSIAIHPKLNWNPWLYLNLNDYIVFLFFVVGIFKIAAETQVLAIRLLGPGGHVAYQPVRLASTLLGSYVLLDEKVANPIEVFGLLVVFSTLVWYFAHGKQCGLESDLKGIKSISAAVASKQHRWCFQRLLWPRPSYRFGKREVDRQSTSWIYLNQRKESMNLSKINKLPKQMKMLRENSNDSSEDSEDDKKLLAKAVRMPLLIKKTMERKKGSSAQV